MHPVLIKRPQDTLAEKGMRIMRGMANGQQHIGDTPEADARTAQAPERPDAIHYGVQTRRVLERLQRGMGGKDAGPLTLQLALDPADVDAQAWDDLLAQQQSPSPFMRHAYLQAMQASGSATAETGWQALFPQLWRHGTDGRELLAACPLYVKSHSYGEYVFDWAWARAYAEHGLDYYPKALIAVPFTPVPGSRLLARSDHWRLALLEVARALCADYGLSSLHLLLGDGNDQATASANGLMLRDGVQFHWQNRSQLQPDTADWHSFDDFLGSLRQDKRKKIRAEQRKVQEAGVQFRWARGKEIPAEDWAFFYRCYERTYLEHGNAPYLTPAFFARMAESLADNWLLFIAEREGDPIACSLIGLHLDPSGKPLVAYGRYWGALERVDCLHFDACYYQPLQWCIEHGVQRFEGGAQGEHKMARALVPSPTWSAHWLAHPEFARAVGRFLEREKAGVAAYQEELQLRSPFRASSAASVTATKLR